MKNKKVRLLIIGITLLIAVAASLFILEKAKITDFIKRDQVSDAPKGPTPEQQAQEAAVNADLKQQLIEEESSNTQPDSNQSDSSKRIELSAKKENNDTITVFTKLYNYSTGSCSLTITNGARLNKQTAAVMYQPEYATCAGFSITKNELGSGSWNITLTVDSEGISTKQSVTFEAS